MIKQGSHGEVERTRMMDGTLWAGLGNAEEMLEIEKHLRSMIETGYSYMFMERWLMQSGYGVNIVRHVFQHLTGLKPEEAVNYKSMYSPGNIPQLNLAWGLAKKGAGSYFIMPIVNWYMIFHQENDQTRTDVSKHLTLMEAKDALAKLVKKVECWDPPVKPNKKMKLDVSQLYKQPQLFMQATECKDLIDKVNLVRSSQEKQFIIDQAYANGTITEATREGLLQVVAETGLEEQVMKDELQKMTDESKVRPLKDQMPTTPQAYFDKKNLENTPVNEQADVINAIMSKIQATNSGLQQFDLAVDETVYKRTPPLGTANQVPDGEPDIMNATAWVAVYLRIVDRQTKIWKPGLMTFEVIGNDIKTEDTIKGDDNRVYALSDQGLIDYFTKEREARGNA